jgi:hypothetical protein
MRMTTALVAALATVGAFAADAEEEVPAYFDDFYAIGQGGVGIGEDGGGAELYVGDDETGKTARGLVRFELPDGIDPTPPTRLELLINATHKDQPNAAAGHDTSAPFTNPGLGDLRAVPVADYDEPGAEDYAAPALGPAVVLTTAGTSPGEILSANVTAAVQYAVDQGHAWVAFRIETAVETDGDGSIDRWYLHATEQGPGLEPLLVVPEPASALAAGVAVAGLALLSGPRAAPARRSGPCPGPGGSCGRRRPRSPGR